MTSLKHRKSYRIASSETKSENDHYCKSLPDLRKVRKHRLITLFRAFTGSKHDLTTSGQVYRQFEWKVFEFKLVLPDGSQERIIGQGDDTIGDLVRPILKRISLNNNNSSELRLVNEHGMIIDLEAKACNHENLAIIVKHCLSVKDINSDIPPHDNNNGVNAIPNGYHRINGDRDRCRCTCESKVSSPSIVETFISSPTTIITRELFNPSSTIDEEEKSDILTDTNTSNTESETVADMPKQLFSGPYCVSGHVQQSPASSSSSSTHSPNNRKWSRIFSSRVLSSSLKTPEQRPLSISCDQLDSLKPSAEPMSLQTSHQTIDEFDQVSHFGNQPCRLVSITSPKKKFADSASHWDVVDACNRSIEHFSSSQHPSLDPRINLGRMLSPPNSMSNESANGKNSESSNSSKKGRRTTINWPFKRNSSSKSDPSLNDPLSTPTSSSTTNSPASVLLNYNRRDFFPLQASLRQQDDNVLSPLITNLLQQLFIKGPGTVGIFRKSANARLCRELKMKLESDANLDLSDYPVTAIASVFKEILRNIPGGLLESRYFDDWMAAISDDNYEKRDDRIAKLLDKLGSFNLLLLKHLICVLWHIAQQSSENKMSSMNLAVCIGPSVFADNSQLLKRCEEVSKLVPKLVAHMIDHCHELFGSAITTLFGPVKDVEKQDSGAEESDSLNSLQDGGINTNGPVVSNKRDDESIESFERIMGEETSSSGSRGSPCKRLSPPSENKMSLSNLSQDSGLTLSDTQLYSPDDGDFESSDRCSPAVGPKLPCHLTKSVPDLETSEDAINVTFSYGRSVGVSIDGSCHDVVRKRRHHDPVSRIKANQINSSRICPSFVGYPINNNPMNNGDAHSLTPDSRPSSLTSSYFMSGQQPRSLQTPSKISPLTHPPLTKSVTHLDHSIDTSSYVHDARTGCSVVRRSSSPSSKLSSSSTPHDVVRRSGDSTMESVLANRTNFNRSKLKEPPSYDSYLQNHGYSSFQVTKSQSSGLLASNSSSLLNSLPSHPSLSQLNKSVPDLEACHDDSINATLSYGRSVGVSIDGSCYDVMRKRRHHDPSTRTKLTQIQGNTVNSTNGPPPYECHMYSSLPVTGNIRTDELENYEGSKQIASRYLRNGNAVRPYRHKRPPLAAVLLVCSLGQESYV
ncbi:uncharacterized protein LOC141851212 [Brevipalpus obovatus]|uniref:uncharacterized protein LOC141851212 n=1 Tax=Brevipalpus obovatus TaxID=246614 RepID=UPI003D9E2589